MKISRVSRIIVIFVIVTCTVMLSSCNGVDVKSIQEENKQLKSQLETVKAELDEVKNGVANRILSIRVANEEKDFDKVLSLSQELHNKFNGTPEDIEAQGYVKAINDKKEADKKAAEEEQARRKEEENKTAQDKARGIIKVFKIQAGKPNSAGGVDLYIGYTNKSPKTIKYAAFTVVPYNKVGDSVKCTIRGYSDFRARDDGPHATGEGIEGNTNWFWENAWYNWSINKLVLTKVEIDYMDGTSTTLKGEDLNYIQY